MKALSTGPQKGSARATLDDVLTPLAFLLLSLLLTAIFFETKDGAPNDTTNGFSCRADNPTFPWQGDWNRIWDSRLFLSITLAFGRFTFSQAKAIDICWDFVIGRGGQMYAAWAAYQVMRKSLIRSMERLSLSTLGRVSADLYASLRKNSRWNWRLVGYLFMITYILSFGTIVGAMTGYQAQMTPHYERRSDGALMKSDGIEKQQHKFPGVVIEDGERMGLKSWETFSNSSQEDYSLVVDYLKKSEGSAVNDTICEENGATSTPNNDDQIPSRFQVMFNWDNETDECVFDRSTIVHSNNTYDLGTIALKARLDDVYIVDELLMNKTYLETTSVCQPEKTYQWGFSSQLLFTFCVATTLYAGVLMALQWDIFWHSAAHRYKQRIGLYRDILDMADEIREELNVQSGEYLTADVLDRMLPTRSGSVMVDTKDSKPRSVEHSSVTDHLDVKVENGLMRADASVLAFLKLRERSGASEPHALGERGDSVPLVVQPARVEAGAAQASGTSSTPRTSTHRGSENSTGSDYL